jgi:hypothetical protein
MSHTNRAARQTQSSRERLRRRWQGGKKLAPDYLPAPFHPDPFTSRICVKLAENNFYSDDDGYTVMALPFAPGDDLIFQLESGFGLLRVLAVEERGGRRFLPRRGDG